MSRGAQLLAACALAVIALDAAPAVAAQKCQVRGLVGVSFGSYDVFAPTPLRAAGSMTLRCNGNRSYLAQIQLSTGASGSYAPRQMRAGPAALGYNLYLDAGATAVWGDGRAGTRSWGPVTLAPHQNHTIPVFGVVPAQQDVPVGSYADSVSVTIIF